MHGDYELNCALKVRFLAMVSMIACMIAFVCTECIFLASLDFSPESTDSIAALGGLVTAISTTVVFIITIPVSSSVSVSSSLLRFPETYDILRVYKPALVLVMAISAMVVFIITILCVFNTFRDHVRLYLQREEHTSDNVPSERNGGENIPPVKEVVKNHILAKLDEQCPPLFYWQYEINNQVREKFKSERRQESDDLEAKKRKESDDLEWPEDRKAHKDSRSPVPSSAPSSKIACQSEVMMCSICLTEFEDEDRVRTLPCSHVFHKACVDQWLVHRNSQVSAERCPLCREYVLAEQQMVPEEMARIQGFWADRDGRVVAAIGKRHILWFTSSQETAISSTEIVLTPYHETAFTLRDNVISIQLDEQWFRGTVEDERITWCDGDQWQIWRASVAQAESESITRHRLRANQVLDSVVLQNGERSVSLLRSAQHQTEITM